MKKIFILFCLPLSIFLFSCDNNTTEITTELATTEEITTQSSTTINAMELYFELLDDYEASQNFTIDVESTVSYSVLGTIASTSAYGHYDIYDNYAKGTFQTLIADIQIDFDFYAFANRETKRNESYIKQSDHFYLYEEAVMSNFESKFLDIDMKSVDNVSLETDGDKDIYTVTLLRYAFDESFDVAMIALFGSTVPLTNENTLDIEVIAKAGKIISITYDLSELINAFIIADNISVKEYSMSYIFDNYGHVEAFTVPNSVFNAKKVLYPDYIGSGSLEAPYQIQDVYDLLAMEHDLSADYILMNNLDLGYINWSPLGTSSMTAFSGTLNGNNKTINNFTMLGTTMNPNVGLFFALVGSKEYVDSAFVYDYAEVYDLSFTNVNINIIIDNWYVRSGVIAGGMNKGNIDNITLSGNVSILFDDGGDNSAYVSMGGLLGGVQGDDSTITNCTSSLTLTLSTTIDPFSIYYHEWYGYDDFGPTIDLSTNTFTGQVITE